MKTGKDAIDFSTNTMNPLQAFLGTWVNECKLPEQHKQVIHCAAILNQDIVTGDDSSFLLFGWALMIPADIFEPCWAVFMILWQQFSCTSSTI